MRVLITGHKGLIGQHLMNYYKKQGCAVFGIDKSFDVASITSYRLSVDLIVHCAAYCRIRECIKYPEECHRTNALGTFRVYEYARKQNIKQVVLFSSSRVEAKHDNVYTAAKKYAEELSKAYRECYGINTIIIRPSTVYGQGDRHDRIIPKFIYSALNDRALTIYGDKNKTLDITSIQDFMQAYDLIIKSGIKNGIFDISRGEEVKIVDVAKHIIDYLWTGGMIVYKPAELAQPQRVKCDISKLKKLGYRPLSWKRGLNIYMDQIMEEIK